jgi:hypothetical protein
MNTYTPNCPKSQVVLANAEAIVQRRDVSWLSSRVAP